MNSKLVSAFIPAHKNNYTVGRSGRKLEAITIHHIAGIWSAKRLGELWQDKSRKGSSHYGIGKDAEIAQYVNEKDTAWTNSNWDSNCKSVTIETSNNSLAPNWTVSDEVLNSLIKLVADIAKRNNIKLVKGKTLNWHSMYTSTACPGPYLMSKIDYIIAEANKINTPAPTPIELKYKVGDKVKIIGKGNGSSDGKSNTAFGIGLQKEILKIYANRAFPYQVGDTNATIGFYKEDALEIVGLEPIKPIPDATIKLGDTVIVNGTGTASSSGLGAKTKAYKNTKMKVLAIFKSAKYPYALNQYNEGKIGNFRDVTAWFSKDSVRK